MTLAAALAAWLTYGLVDAAMHLERLHPAWSRAGMFQRALLAIDRIWSGAHGWPPWSHLGEFGRFYARAVPLGCALGGFGLFLLLARGHPPCTRVAGAARALPCPACAPFRPPAPYLWKIPLLAAVCLVQLPGIPFGWVAWAEAARTALVVTAMARTAGEKYLQYRAAPGHSVS